MAHDATTETKSAVAGKLGRKFAAGALIEVGPAYRGGGHYAPDGHEGVYTVVGHLAPMDYYLVRGDAREWAEKSDYTLICHESRIGVVTNSQEDSEPRDPVAGADESAMRGVPQLLTDARATAGKAVEERSTGASRDEGATASPAAAKYSPAARELAAYHADIYKAKRNARVAKKGGIR